MIQNGSAGLGHFGEDIEAGLVFGPDGGRVPVWAVGLLGGDEVVLSR